MMCPDDGTMMELWVLTGDYSAGWICPYCKQMIPRGSEDRIERYPANNED
jgi:hypothetical protein